MNVPKIRNRASFDVGHRREGFHFELRCFVDRLRNPEILEEALAFRFDCHDTFDLAVPVGGARRGGAAGSLSRAEAKELQRCLLEFEGFPHPRFVPKGGGIYWVEWGFI